MRLEQDVRRSEEMNQRESDLKDVEEVYRD